MRIRSPFLTRIIARAIVLLGRLLFLTCRKRYVVEVAGTNPYEETADRYLYCVWHDHIVMTVFSGRPKSMAGLVSRHQDGSFLSETMKRLAIQPVRGSASRGGAQAMRQMLDLARERHIAITPDGPRGPRRQAKDGIIFLASHSGRKIVPVFHACRSGWQIRGSWTDMLLPRPFTTVYAFGGTPISIPPGLTREQIGEHTARLQSEMDRLAHIADAYVRDGGNRQLDANCEATRAAA